MKPEIHPAVHNVTIKCACGNELQTISTLKDIHVTICAACHPFYTGKQKILDTAGRVERFNKKYEQKSAPAKKGPRTITIND